MRRIFIAFLTTTAALLAIAAAAQAVVVNDQGRSAGVAMVPGTGSSLAKAGISTVDSTVTTCDPWLTPDLSFSPESPVPPLCWHGGAVMHRNETFAVTWDPLRRYWETTRDYVEQFMSNVAASSGALTTPFADTTQYTDPAGRASNHSIYGGGCIDYGSAGGYTCKFGDSNGSGAGHDYPGAGGCAATGFNHFHEAADGTFDSLNSDTIPNDTCITDSQIGDELANIIGSSGIVGRTSSGYTPLVVMLTPPGVEVCLDSAGNLCSANGASTAQFCSYHGRVAVGSTEVAYVVQPWTALTACDEPDVPPIPFDTAIPPQTLATDVGTRLVSPLSQGELASAVNPALDGWFTSDGAEINDNGCVPLAHQLDAVVVGNASYFLQREFNNAGAIETDPNALTCVPWVGLQPTFVVPQNANPSDVVDLDGSTTVSTLMIPRADYAWSFGDGATATGPSVAHSYAKPGHYTITLWVMDRGGNVATSRQTIDVLSPNGTTPPPPPSHTSRGLHAHLTLMPQSLRSALHRGVSVAVTANETADGIAMVSISRGVAGRAHIKHGRGATVVIGRGTVSGVKAGTVKLHLRLPHGIASHLGHLHHLTLTVRLTLVAAGGAHVAIDAAGRY